MARKLLLIAIAAVCLIGLIAIVAKAKKNAVSLPAGESRETAASASALLVQAKEAEAKGDLLAAKTLYQQLVTTYPNAGEASNWQKKSDNLNIRLLFSPAITPKSILYEIKPGDTLTKIARQFKTTVDLIRKSNSLSGDRIVPGKKLKVWTAPFSIVVDKSQNILMLKTKGDEEIIKTYIVSTGLNNSTPIGTYKIVNKLVSPAWFKAGAVVPASSPENILGSRWMGFDLAGYGIHGTTEPQNLGKQVTQGCVRMSNAEVEELFTIIPEGTEVTIID